MIGSEKLSGLHPVFRAAVDYLLEEAERRGLHPQVVEGWRSPARQEKLYAQGRTTRGRIVTRARAWQSAHQYGLACDITSTDGWESASARRIAQLARAFGFGTIPGDLPHVEFPGWKEALR